MYGSTEKRILEKSFSSMFTGYSLYSIQKPAALYYRIKLQNRSSIKMVGSLY